MHKQNGFTLVEILVSLTILSIIASLATASYTDHITKTKASEALTVSGNVQDAVKNFYLQNGKVAPSTLAELYGTSAGSTATDHIGRFVSSADLDAGSIVVTYGIGAPAVLDGKVLTFTPHETIMGAILWRCGLATAPVDGLSVALPLAGASAGAPIAGTLQVTNVDSEFLPASCR